MTAIALRGLDLGPSLERAISAEAQDVRRLVNHTQGSPSIQTADLRFRALRALTDAIESAYVDGLVGRVVDAETLVNAMRFLALLPASVQLPEMSVDSDGDIALDWDKGPRQVFSVRVSRDGTLYHAGLIGSSSFHGTDFLGDSIPPAVALGIDRAFSGH